MYKLLAETVLTRRLKLKTYFDDQNSIVCSDQNKTKHFAKISDLL